MLTKRFGQKTLYPTRACRSKVNGYQKQVMEIEELIKSSRTLVDNVVVLITTTPSSMISAKKPSVRMILVAILERRWYMAITAC